MVRRIIESLLGTLKPHASLRNAGGPPTDARTGLANRAGADIIAISYWIQRKKDRA